jgi:hypothetical protein
MSTEPQVEISPSQQDAAQTSPDPVAQVEGQAAPQTEDASKPAPRPRVESIPYNRFQEVNTKYRQEQQARAALEQRIAELEGRNQPQGPQKPDPSQFNSREEFDRAVDQYIEQVSQSKVQQTTQTLRQQQEQEALVSGFNSRLAPLAKENPQYIAAVQVFASMEGEMNPQVFRDIVADEDGPRIAWEIATDPDFAEAVMSASPAKAGRLIERRLAQAQSSTASQQPPKPAIPVTKTVSGAGAASKNPEEMTTAEYIAWRESQEK